MPAFRHTRLIAVLTAVGVATSSAAAIAAPKKPTKPSAPAKVSKPTKTATNKGKPDLVIRTLDVEFTDDTTLRVRSATSNAGQGTPKRAGKTTLALSSDTKLGPGDTLLAEVSTGRPRPGFSTPFTRRLALPDTLPSTDIYLVVCADSGNRIIESKEANNCNAELLWEAAENDDEYGDDEGDDDGDDGWDDEDY